jgi:hypothetical protein
VLHRAVLGLGLGLGLGLELGLGLGLGLDRVVSINQSARVARTQIQCPISAPNSLEEITWVNF